MESHVADRRKHPRVSADQSCWRAVRLRTGDELALINLAHGGALVESRRRLLPGAKVVLQVSLDGGALAIQALVTRCAVHALRCDFVEYRGALQFEQELDWVGNGSPIDLCA